MRSSWDVFIGVHLELYLTIGERLAGWKEKSMADDGAIDWLAQPLYPLIFEGGFLKKAYYLKVGGVEGVKPERVGDLKGFGFAKPCSDDEAHFVHGEAKFHVETWFADGAGPNEYRLDKAGNTLQALGLLVAKNIGKKMTELKAITGSSETSGMGRSEQTFAR